MITENGAMSIGSRRDRARTQLRRARWWLVNTAKSVLTKGIRPMPFVADQLLGCRAAGSANVNHYRNEAWISQCFF